LTSDGRFDLDAAREAGFEGSLDLSGFEVDFDPVTGEPLFSPDGESRDPDDVYWSSEYNLSDLSGTAYAVVGHDGGFVVGGAFVFANTSRVSHVAHWDGESWNPLGSGTNGTIFVLAYYDQYLVAGGQVSSFGIADLRDLTYSSRCALERVCE
jgi:hypothetical protein